jgi:hypothetical protein
LANARDARGAGARPESSIPPIAVASPNAGSGRVAMIALAVMVAAGGLLLLGSHADSRLSYELRGASAEGGLIEAKRGEATVSLSDGSSILAENQTKFSVDVVGRNAASARLVSGKLHVRVQHHEDTSYRFIAGPYEVHVVGTEFDLAWDASGAGLTLAMAQGEVRLTEPGGKLRALRAGQSLHLPSPTALLRPAAEVNAPSSLSALALAAHAGAAAAGATPAEPSTWDALVARGQFADVVQEAETLGVDDITASRGPADLTALGQAARYVGKRALSLRAFSALRERNRGTEPARQAAFFLARVQEERGNRAEALQWLDTYLTEASTGVYADEASGRRLGLTEALRGRAAALPLARDYLERFPEGSFAASARALSARD